MSELNQTAIEIGAICEIGEQKPVSGGAPLVERSMLFDFMVLSQPVAEAQNVIKAEPHVASPVAEEEIIDSVEIPVTAPVIVPQVNSQTSKASFELDEHLKMLCDTELIEQIQSIPKRISFKIGEVADLVGVKSFVLRFWETEFDLLKPKKASNNQRMYSKKDVEVSFLIKKLLYRDRFSIEGARNVIKQARTQMKTEVSKFEEASTAKQKMETLTKLQNEKLAEMQIRSNESELPQVDRLVIETIHESVDQILNRLSQLKELFR